MNTQSLASLTLIGATSLWGLYWVPLYLLEARGLSGILTVVALNLAPAIVLLLAALWSKADPKHMRRALFVGSIAGLGFVLYSAGIIYGSVVRATLLFYLTPIWSTLIGIVALSEKVTWRRWLAIAVGLTGVALLVGGGQQADISLGDILAFGSGLAWAIAAVMIKRSPELPLSALTGAQFACVSAVALLMAIIMGAEWPTLETLSRTLPLGSLIALFVLCPSVFGIIWAQKHVFPGRAGLLMMSEALVAVVSAAIFLPEERMGALQWLGGILIVGTFFIETAPIPTLKKRRSA